jgi:transcriptional regulator with XRE-family HTH domain
MKMGSMISKAKTRKEVAGEFGISEKTLSRWLKKSNLNIPSGLINPFHLRIIYGTFGVPDIIKTA